MSYICTSLRRAVFCSLSSCWCGVVLYLHCPQQHFNFQRPAVLATGSRALTPSPGLSSKKLPIVHTLFADFMSCCAIADAQSGPGVLAANAARRWLARNAAGVKVLCSWTGTTCMSDTCMTVPAYMSLVSCLPALEAVELCLSRPLISKDLGCLLEALAWLPRLGALALEVEDSDQDDTDSDYYSDSSSDDEGYQPCPDTSAFVKLRSLTKLALTCGRESPYTVAGVVEALVSLTGLAELRLGLPQSRVVPAALGQVKGLRFLALSYIRPCVLAAGCLELPNLLNLEFACCKFADAQVLPGVSALQSLTSIKLLGGKQPHFFDHQLVQLAGLQSIIFDARRLYGGGTCLARLPADMASLSSTLLHLSFRGAGLIQFPLVVTQLVALQHLDAYDNAFAVLPAAITALSRLTELVLGRGCGVACDMLQQNERRPLDVRALRELSAFPALCRLSFSYCEVVLCKSVLGAVRHTSLASIAFIVSHPAPECAPMVLQLSQSLRRLGGGSVLSFRNYMSGMDAGIEHAFEGALSLPPLTSSW